MREFLVKYLGGSCIIFAHDYNQAVQAFNKRFDGKVEINDIFETNLDNVESIVITGSFKMVCHLNGEERRTWAEEGWR